MVKSGSSPFLKHILSSATKQFYLQETIKYNTVEDPFNLD
jgi:hypothetical protein